MKCLVLAAGYATRLYPLTENFPKPLLEVGGKTILDWLVDDIASCGKVDEFIIISNHRFAGHFEAWASSRNSISDSGKGSRTTDRDGEVRSPARVTVLDDGTSTNETRLGAVRDILFAREELHLDDDLLIVAGDNVLDFSLTRFIEYALARGTSCIMRYNEPSEARLHKSGIVEIAGDAPESASAGGQDSPDRVVSMEEKPAEPKSHWCCPPFYFYTRRDAALIAEGIAAGCGTDAPGSFAAWLASRTVVNAMEMPGSRYDIGNLESYRNVCETYKGITK